MSKSAFHKGMVAFPLVAMLALAGCGGGGGGGGTAGGPPQNPGGGGQMPGGGGQMPGGGTPSPDPLMAASGLRIGEADATTGAVTLSSTAVRDYDANRVSLTEGAYIKSVSDDGSGGYSVTYVSDGVELVVAFASADLGALQPNGIRDPNTYYKEVGGENFYFWFTGSRGPNYEQFGSSSRGESNRFRTYVAVGTKTDASALPGGTATYHGSVWGDMYDNNDSNPTGSRARASGRLTLTANFSGGSVGGRIWNLRIQENGAASSDPRHPAPLSSVLRIHDGRIVDGQFTAELTGEDDDSSVAFEDSARGFEGDMVGAFYGPAAEEVGGVFNAKRDSGGLDQVLVGRFGGSEEREIAIDSSTQLSSLVHRDYGSSQTAIRPSDVAMVETTANGYRITFTIDGVQKAVDVTEADLGGIGGNTYNFEKVVDTASVSRRFYLWRFAGSFPGQAKFDYLDVNGVILSDFTPGVAQETASLNDVASGYIVRGTRTSASDMPTGSASYSGEMHAREWPTDTLSSYTAADEYRGDFSMAADFAAGTVTGTVSNVDSRPGSRGTYTSSPSTGLTFQGTVSGNEITASALAGTGAFAGYSGTAEGAFYGPAAAEVGGVFEGTATDKLLQGYFAGDKQ